MIVDWLFQGIVSGVVASIIFTLLISKVDFSCKRRMRFNADKLSFMLGVMDNNIRFVLYDLAIIDAKDCINIVDSIHLDCNYLNISKVQRKWVISLL